MDHINPRPLFRRAVEMLTMAECPHCHRSIGSRDLVMNRPAFHCSWCASRERVLAEYKDWLQQDSAKAPQRAAKPVQS